MSGAWCEVADLGVVTGVGGMHDVWWCVVVHVLWLPTVAIVHACSDHASVCFKVEGILDHRVVSGKKQFLVKWKNYDIEWATWEPEANLSCEEVWQVCI